MLVDSGFPLDLQREGGLTALMIGASMSDDIGIRMCHKIIEGGADVNMISDAGDSALSEAIVHENKKCVDTLIKVQANLMYEDKSMAEKSPFFQAIRTQKKWAVESMCDNGAEVEELKANGRSPLLYSAINGFDEVCMYLCLRVKDVDVEDE